MRILKSFLLRFAQILTASCSLFLFLMSATYFMQMQKTHALVAIIISAISIVGVFITNTIIKRKDPELVTQVARLLYPLGGISSLVISFLLASVLTETLENPTSQHFVLIFAGVGILLFLLIRCFDIKFLRDESELPKSAKKKL